MTSAEEFVPNERLRRARSLKDWSQAELAEQVGTSFEVVSRWERGVTVPSPYYRERLCAVLGQSAEELGFVRGRTDAFTSPSTPLVFFASSHEDAEKAPVSHLKTALQEQGFTLWSSRQLSRQGNGNAHTSLREIVRTAQVIVVIVSPDARASRHVREALELASKYQRPVCGVWIEGERWQECLPKGNGELAALIDVRTSDSPVLNGEMATALKRVGLTSADNGRSASVDPEGQVRVSELLTSSKEPQAVDLTSNHTLEPPVAATRLSAEVPLLTPAGKRQRRGVSRRTAGLLLGLIVLVLAGGILGSLSLLAHFGVIGTRSAATTPVRGGTWIDDFNHDIVSLIPNGSSDKWSGMVDQALYLPLFYGDAQGVVHPGAAREIPTVQNGGISIDAKTWTFHLRPRLAWSDGQPYDARDVDYTWQLWRNPKFGAANPLGSLGLDLINSADVSMDQLSITFHLKQPFAPFLADLWVDGFMAPLPAHRFSAMAPEAILKSPENLKPTVTSGPFILSDAMPGCDFIVVRNPRYYRASEGLPYLDKIVFRVDKIDARFHDLQAGSIDSAWFLDMGKVQQYQRFIGYTLITPPASAAFEAMYFNFHNPILASHPEVRQAMAMAIDHQTLINVARHGFANPLCTDHPLALHPGYDPAANCSAFDPAVANQLLDDNGWVKGADGVRTQAGQRLAFEYSTPTTSWPLAIDSWRIDGEAILQRNLREIGIQLDIQNYPGDTFFSPFLNRGQASPPTGAVAGRYDIAEFANNFGYDPDDSSLFLCNQFPPKGRNYGFYCNPAVDELYKQEVAALDPSLRQDIFQQIHDIYLTQLPFIVLYSPTDTSIVRKGTHNYQLSPFSGEINIWQWWCDKGKC
jgi:peptide/nickel transport system substrate-binding protein